jgi:tRNA (uracil-5-)-methyltransferase
MAKPKCKYFGKCGGCSAQHVDYDWQLKNKKKQVFHAIGYDDIQVFSDVDYEYRNRMDLIFHRNGLGFRQKGSWWKIIDIDECLISNKKLNELLKEIREHFKIVDSFDLKKQYGTYKYALIRTPNENCSISFALNEDSPRLKEAVEKIKEFAKITTADNVVITYLSKKMDMSTSSNYFSVKGDELLFEHFLENKFYYHVQGFFQNNTKMAESMLKYTKDILSKYDTKNYELLDLYGGVGTFGILNAKNFKEVTIIESLDQSIDCANKNIVENKISNAKAQVLDAKQLKKLKFGEKLFVITDPPRSGMHKDAITQLKALNPEVIIYVSCNAQQLKKDIFKFSNYEIKSAGMFDLFPQTPHVETVVELVRK